jgi:thioredoxin-dependent peroxiredoxin
MLFSDIHKKLNHDSYQFKKEIAMPHINQSAPDFTQKAFFKNEAINLNLYDYIGDNWVVLFSHPKDFTPVCTTELGEGQKRIKEFEQRDTKLLALSVDSLKSHEDWIDDIIQTSGSASFDYPIISDDDRKVSLLYDLIHPEADDTFTVRSVYFIDPQKKIRTILTYPHTVGRNFDELLRILDALQTVDRKKVATPVNWKPGDKAIIPPSIKDTANYKSVEVIKPYLRYTDIS